VTNYDPAEIARFDATANRWWDADGDMRPLHDLNPVRLGYVERVGALAGKAIADIGCGGGLLAEAMARKGGRVLGIDLASELLNVARLHAMRDGVAVDYERLSAEALAEARPGAFDLVTCMEMLEHVPDPSAVIGALARLVRPGGDVFVSTLNRTPRAYLLAVLGAEYVLRLLPTGTHSYEKFIRPSELAQWAREHGLELADVAGIEYDPFARTARLTNDARVNYLVHLRRPAAGARPQ
jgi:2-polyprenyl-6-hydroxyphenyl methylase/3-demethylubiquinone-9 3-methyltransferase